jgi:hypothetical protein
MLIATYELGNVQPALRSPRLGARANREGFLVAILLSYSKPPTDAWGEKWYGKGSSHLAGAPPGSRQGYAVEGPILAGA